MISQALGRRIQALASTLLLAFILTLVVVTGGLSQTIGSQFRAQQPELADLLDAAYLAQATVFDEILAIDDSPATREARDQFEASLRMRANMSMADMMVMMRMQSGSHALGPFDELEFPVSMELRRLLQTPHSRREVRDAFDDSSLPDRAVEVVRLGRVFETRVFEILADQSIDDRAAALDDAVEAYLADAMSVPGQPKPASLLLDHPYAGTFAEAYPKLSGLLWAGEWLQLAAMEAMIFEQRNVYYSGSVEKVKERFQGKIADSEKTESPAPVELPMVPAIAPTLFSLSPQTAIVLDNLNMFETVVADILAYPNLDNKAAKIDSVVDDFTDHANGFDETMDYLVSALRGGIYNQGGPAIGELTESERNRSRMEMGMQHSMIMSVP
jgi:hypothetical protein